MDLHEAELAVKEAAESLAMLRMIGAPAGDIEAAEIILANAEKLKAEQEAIFMRNIELSTKLMCDCP